MLDALFAVSNVPTLNTIVTCMHVACSRKSHNVIVAPADGPSRADLEVSWRGPQGGYRANRQKRCMIYKKTVTTLCMRLLAMPSHSSGRAGFAV